MVVENRRLLLLKIMTVTLSVCLCLLGVELTARVYFAFSPPISHEAFRKTQPPPYQKAHYFSQEFIKESFKQPNGWTYPKGTRLIIPNDFSGKWFNISNGIRATSFQPEDFTNTVYLFGGSTIYCSEVPDDFTVPSHLQLLFTQFYGSKYRVLNYGTTTVTIAQQLERLKTITFGAGDIVIFYDGVNDVSQSIYYANPNETMIERNQRSIREMSFLARIYFYLDRKYSGKSAMVKLIFHNPSRPPEHFSDIPLMQNILTTLEKRYKTSIVEAHKYCIDNGAKFMHFLQPHLYSDFIYTDYEIELMKNNYIIHPSLYDAFLYGYPVLKKAVTTLPVEISSFDLSGVLDEYDREEEIYLDVCHVNHRGNKIIAESIFQGLRNSLEH